MIMKSLNGDITFRSYRGYGTSFDFFFKTEYNRNMCNEEDLNSSLSLSAVSLASFQDEQTDR